MPDDSLERECWVEGKLLLGVDEAGAGSLSGSLFVAGAVFPAGYDFARLAGLNDSKQLSETKRFELEPLIKADALYWFCEEATAAEIDAGSVYKLRFSLAENHISFSSMIPPPASLVVLMDGNRSLKLNGFDSRCLVKADSKCFTVAAASVIAKTAKDRQARELDRLHPQYGWAGNKGYGSPGHQDAIRKFGLTSHHRKTFCKNFVSGG